MDPSEDPIYSPNFTTYIITFMKQTSKECSIQDLDTILILLKESNYIKTLAMDPTNNAAISCIKQFLNGRNDLPSNFLDRLISVFRTRIRFVPSVLASSSVTAKVKIDYLEPEKKMTNLNITGRMQVMKANCGTNVKILEASDQIVPTLVKTNMTSDSLNNAIKSTIILHDSIEEYNRQNGYVMDPYIPQQTS